MPMLPPSWLGLAHAPGPQSNGCDTSLKEWGRQHKQAVWEVGVGDEAVTHMFW